VTVSTPASLTWIGHATSVLDIGGFRVMTDPLLRRRVAHLRRRVGPVPAAPEIDLVLLSHAHMDHLHVPSLRRIPEHVPVVAPRGTSSLLRRAGRREIVEVVVGDRVDVGAATVTVTPADHPRGRGPHSRVIAEPIGFVIEIAGHRTYFAGDTDLFDEMGALGPVDLALLPIWGWGPSIGVGHLDPERAVEAAGRIGPGLVVPIHWGTFAPEDLRRRVPGWLAAPAVAFEQAIRGSGVAATVLVPGGSLTL
jgi:L-ascorbate metabolism protein UlaG (beta-lactamase superfamily)